MEKIWFDSLKKNNIITGRGSTAIYLVFCNERMKNRDVIVPGNICYAAVYPVIRSGNNVVFCDVDSQSGNLTKEILEKYKTADTGAVIVPHMYGNTVDHLDQIKSWCEENCILMIEDCASCLGSFSEKYGQVGNLGDYVIYSFGYSKIADLGKGGMLSSDRDLCNACSILNAMNSYDEKTRKMEDAFSSAYRYARYKSHDYEPVAKMMCDELFLYAIDDSESFKKLLEDKELIQNMIEKHKNNYDLYDSLLASSLNRYRYNKGSVPWRFSLLIDTDKRRAIIDRLLQSGLPVSDWYPNITEMFCKSKIELPGVDILEKRIVNFPLDTDEETIKKICDCVNDCEVER